MGFPVAGEWHARVEHRDVEYVKSVLDGGVLLDGAPRSGWGIWWLEGLEGRGPVESDIGGSGDERE
jgi:hypothetical protein